MYKCPVCGSTKLHVEIPATFNVVQGNPEIELEYAGDNNGLEGDSIMTCYECDHCDPASSFVVGDK